MLRGSGTLVLGLLAGLDGALQGETLVLLQLGLLSLLRDVTLLLRLLDSVTVGLVVLVVVGVVLGLGHFSVVVGFFVSCSGIFCVVSVFEKAIPIRVLLSTVRSTWPRKVDKKATQQPGGVFGHTLITRSGKRPFVGYRVRPSLFLVFLRRERLGFDPGETSQASFEVLRYCEGKERMRTRNSGGKK